MLTRTFLGNTFESYLWCAGILVAGLLFKRILSRWISAAIFRFFSKRSHDVGASAFVSLLSAPFQFLIMVILIYFACSRLTFPQEWQLASGETFGLRFVLDHLYKGLLVAGATWLVMRSVDFAGMVLIARAHRTNNHTDDQLVPFLKEAVKVLLGGIGFLIMLAVAFNLDIVSLVTGLGIGGLAFALAAKETLENLLGSFTIFLDKPFVVGDQVKVGAIEGVVESIGFRSTRIRALDRMLVTVPNKRMVDAELINETDREFRRYRCLLQLNPEVKIDDLEAFLTNLRAFLTQRPHLEGQPQVHLKGISTTGLEVQVIAVLRLPDAEIFAAEQELINIKIIELVQQHHLSFSKNAWWAAQV